MAHETLTNGLVFKLYDVLPTTCSIVSVPSVDGHRRDINYSAPEFIKILPQVKPAWATTPNGQLADRGIGISKDLVVLF